MSVKETVEERLEELKGYLFLLKKYLPLFKASIGLQKNETCPNVNKRETNWGEMIYEIKVGLEMIGELNIPVIPKLNVLTPIEVAKEISESEHCDALCVSNTIPWGKLPERIDWEGLFGSKTSPLARFGGGGYSGAGLLPLVCDWIKEARYAGIKKHINVGGGILRPDDVNVIHKVGGNSISLGSIRILRWRRMPATIKRSYELF